jgi:thymidine phosphorylase
VELAHPRPLESLSEVRRKLYGGRLDGPAFERIVRDVTAGRYSEIEIASLVTACSGRHLDRAEIAAITRAMVDAGERLLWDVRPVLDKHSVGGLPGNHTPPVVVSIAAACGFTMPKTSSLAVTSAAGTADVKCWCPWTSVSRLCGVWWTAKAAASRRADWCDSAPRTTC